MAATTMTVPSQITGNVYPNLHAYNGALYEYTLKQFEDAQKSARERRVSNGSHSSTKRHTSAPN